MSKTVGGSVPVQRIRLATAITFAAWVELDSALDADVSGISIMNATDQDLRLGIGAAGAEVDYLYICKGAATAPTVLDRPAVLSKGARLAVRALAADSTTGVLVITLWS